MNKKTMLLWGGGKESALSFKLLQDNGYNVTDLLVLTDQGHGVYNEKLLGVRTQRNYIPISIIEAQARELSVNLVKVEITDISNLSEYYDSLIEWSEKCKLSYENFKVNGGTHIAFGYFSSMCLESKNVGLVGLESVYPLMDMSEDDIINQLVNDNYKCKIIRTSPSVNGLPAYSELCGSDWTLEISEKCSQYGISPIGEDGSFGTICYDAPIFNNPIAIQVNNILTFDVDELLSASKLSDMNAFNVLQLGAKRTFADISL